MNLKTTMTYFRTFNFLARGYEFGTKSASESESSLFRYRFLKQIYYFYEVSVQNMCTLIYYYIYIHEYFGENISR